MSLPCFLCGHYILDVYGKAAGNKEPHVDLIKEFLLFRDPRLGAGYSDHVGLWAAFLGKG